MVKQKLRSAIVKTLILILLAIVAAILLTNAINQEKSVRYVKDAILNADEKKLETVSKKQFAKRLWSTLGLTPQKEKCVKDVVLKESGEICALYKKGVFTGSKNSRFYPKKAATWDFAIKSLCISEKWVKKISYTACFKHAKKNRLISTSLAKTVFPKKLISSLELEDILGKIYPKRPAAEKTKIPPVTTTQPGTSTTPSIIEKTNAKDKKIPPPGRIEGNFPLPVAAKTIPADTFAHIVLSQPIPNNFYINEVYFIEGDLTGITAEEVFVFLCPEVNGDGCGNSINFIEKTKGNHFRIPIHFKTPGNFQLGIIPGRSGKSRVEDISVLPESPPEPSGGRSATALSIGYSQGNTTFHWDGEGNATRLVIFQETRRKDYVLRQPITSYTPNPLDFANFKPGPASWFVRQNSLMSPIKDIVLTTREFRKVSDAEIRIKTLQEVFPDPATFTFQGTSLTAINKTAAFTMTDGTVHQITLGKEDLPPQTDIDITMKLTNLGTYIFEINNTEGNAVINVPIYVGEVIPLLPDFFDLNPGKLNSAPIQDLGTLRKEFLELINKDRSTNGLSPVSISEELNSLAQSHSEDMIVRNFFGHVNPSGAGPDDRRKNAKITTTIRENLGKGSDLPLIEAGLMRSPLHRSAILDSSMKRVGLGIAKNGEGYLFITQHFAPDPVSKADLPRITETLYEAANKNRKENGLTELSKNSVLHDVATLWSARMANENFFGTKDSSGNSIVKNVRNSGIRSALFVHIVETSSVDSLQEELLGQDSLKESTNQIIGIGIAMTDAGKFMMTVIYGN